MQAMPTSVTIPSEMPPSLSCLPVPRTSSLSMAEPSAIGLKSPLDQTSN